MTREQAKQNLVFIKAFAEGKTIQYLSNRNGCWEDMNNNIGFTEDPDSYRVKPEPRIIDLPRGMAYCITQSNEARKFIELTPEVETALKEKGIL